MMQPMEDALARGEEGGIVKVGEVEDGESDAKLVGRVVEDEVHDAEG